MALPDSGRTEVVVVDVQMRFMSMVVFMVKWVIASIPAFLILAALGALLATVLGRMISGA